MNIENAGHSAPSSESTPDPNAAQQTNTPPVTPPTPPPVAPQATPPVTPPTTPPATPPNTTEPVVTVTQNDEEIDNLVNQFDDVKNLKFAPKKSKTSEPTPLQALLAAIKVGKITVTFKELDAAGIARNERNITITDGDISYNFRESWTHSEYYLSK